MAYNKDNQEDKEPLFDSIDTLKDSLRAFTDMFPAIVVKGESMREAASEGFATATDLADYLVRKGVPFRDAHEIVGRTVKLAINREKDLAELDLQILQSLCSKIEDDVYDVLTLEGSIASRNLLGGTAPQQVRQQVIAARKQLGL